MIERNRWVKDLLWVLVLLGALAIVFRLRFGLGATTNLSDSVPWGLWKILNMVAGVAVATGGFTIGFLVYVLRMERFRPLVKPAILIAFLGYGSSCFALFLDIGLPHRIWHPIVMWNERSFLFEVAWCVMLYFTVTMVELGPTVLERIGLGRSARFLHHIAFGVVVTGIALSSLHHSSLGSLFLVTPLRLHPLWFTSWLPVHFILSAMGAGMMMVVLVKILYARTYDPESVFGAAPADGPAAAACPATGGAGGEVPAPGPDFPMVRRLAVIAGGVLSVYLTLKLVDLVRLGTWRAVVAGSWESYFFVGEILVATVLPLALLIWPRGRRSPAVLATAAGFAVAGLLWNRLDVGIFGYLRDAGSIYVPSVIEWALSLGVVAAAVLAFLYAVENLPIFDASWRNRREGRSRFRPAFDRASMVWRTALGRGLERVTLFAVFVLALGWVAMYPPYHDRREPDADADAARPPMALDVERAKLKLDVNRSGMAVVFPHKDHQQRLGKEASCVRCHHLTMPGDHSTPCSRCHRAMESDTDLFRPGIHLARLAEKEKPGGLHPSNRICGKCHTTTARSVRDAKPCLDCHREDMVPQGTVEEAGKDLRWVPGYRAAMHGTCVKCHEKERDRVKRPDLADCSNCHVELRYREISPPIELARATVPDPSASPPRSHLTRGPSSEPGP